ncbi:MAG TPA: tRNA lysidine(34) synthetase TilS [Candidatus Acidoferrum sp.]|nr:tRNA lysidine(34) synthetase TilS [Candidatus Acidoferrum sp.]
MRTSLSQRLLQHMKAQKFVRPGDRVGVAVSGGADSVALLLLLLELRKKLGIVLSVVHFNHKLRGKASDADEEFVTKIAGKHGLEFYLERGDVGCAARSAKANVEETARILRRDFFWRLAQSGKLKYIAVGHTADDQAETVLGHTLRGTGLAGLGGIHPFAGPIFRPLLWARRAELRSYLRSRRQKWREDASNLDETRFRARIRRRLIPQLESHFQEKVVLHLAKLSELAREDEGFFDSLMERLASTLLRGRFGDMTIKVRDLIEPLSAWGITGASLSPKQREEQGAKNEYGIPLAGAPEPWRRDSARTLRAVSKRLVRRIAESVKLAAGEWSSVHIEAVLELAEQGRPGQSISLPGNVEVRRNADELRFFLVNPPWEKGAKGKNHKVDFEHLLFLGRHFSSLETSSFETCRVPELGCAFRFTVIDWPSTGEENNKREMVLDRERLRLPLVLRNWRPGDRLRPSGHQNAHKLKRLLNEKHVSHWEREGWPVLTSGGVLVWARGFPVAADFAANEKTRTGIVIAEEKI